MIIIEKNEGTKVDYTVTGTKVNFAGEVTLDLSKYERDFPVHLDICQDRFGFLTMGLADRYVAQIDIPERQYAYQECGTDEEGNPKMEKVPVSFDMDNVIITLWSMEGLNNA